MTKNQECQVRESTVTASGVTALIVLCILGFITASTRIMGGLSPINVAIVACTSFFGGTAAFAVSLIAYFINGTAVEALPNICAMTGILGIKFLIHEVWQKKTGAVSSAVIATAAMLISGVGTLLFTDVSAMLLLLRLSQAAICGSTAFFIITAAGTIKRENVIPVTGASAASMGVLFVLTLATLTSLDFSSINIGRVVGILVMLPAIKKYRHFGGAVCGVLTSCGVILCSPQLGKSTMLLACAGLIAGVFSEFGIGTIIVTFIAANSVGLLAIGVTNDTVPMLYDIAVATIIFALVPSRVWTRVLQSVGTAGYAGEEIARNAEEKLNFAANTIKEVRESINKVSTVMERKNLEQDLASKVCEGICGKCKNNLLCWESNFDETNTGFYKLESYINLLGKVEQDNFPSELSHCVKKDLLENEFNTMYNEVNYQNKLGQRLKEMRSMLSDQFTAMEEMLSSLGGQLSGYATADLTMSKKIADCFSRNGIRDAKVCVYENRFGSLTVEAFIPKNIKPNDAELSCEISEIAEKEMELPKYSTVNGVTRIELWEKPKYAIDMGASQIPGTSTEITGDSYETFLDNQSEAYIVLSDGMGSGKRAQLDSLLTSSLISRLIRAGIGYSSAIRLMNSSMKVKAWEESFATVDISVINLCEGTLDVVKAGASATYLIRGEELRRIEAVSLPIGILQEVTPAKISVKLKPYDLVITASDGVVDEHLETIRQTVVENKNLSAKELSDLIIKNTRHIESAFPADDITVIVSKINRNK